MKSPLVTTIFLSLVCSIQGLRVNYRETEQDPKRRVTVAVQYFKHADNIKPILEAFDKSPVVKEVFIADDSHEVADWSEFTGYKYKFSRFERPNQHEIRNYNYMTEQATGDFVLFWQDDNIPSDVKYLEDAVKAFDAYPTLGLLALDPAMKNHPPRFQGAELLERGTIGCHWTCEHGMPEVDVPTDISKDKWLKEPQSGRNFAFTWGTSLFAYMARRSSFVEFGKFDEKYSEPGQPGIGFEEAAGLKTWSMGKMFAVMDIREDGSQIGIGGHASKDKTNPNSKLRMKNEKKNIGLMGAEFGTRMPKMGDSIIAANTCLVHSGENTLDLANCLNKVPKVPQ